MMLPIERELVRKGETRTNGKFQPSSGIRTRPAGLTQQTNPNTAITTSKRVLRTFAPADIALSSPFAFQPPQVWVRASRRLGCSTWSLTSFFGFRSYLGPGLSTGILFLICQNTTNLFLYLTFLPLPSILHFSTQLFFVRIHPYLSPTLSNGILFFLSGNISKPFPLHSIWLLFCFFCFFCFPV